ncbi:response regulator [Saccharothrix sp.]|uniref:response regulator n=1 Tax=Saccharothrix sp. TaxID=1873460 RepID=UPI00281166CF|nr:response regulator [Saccharothrix sp.]
MGRTALIVDDSAEFRAVARVLLEAGGYRVCAEAATGEDAVARAVRERPDVVLLDVGLPDRDGFDVCREVRRRVPDSVVVLCSVRDEECYGDAVARCGAAGFVAKAALTAEAVTAYVERR